MSDFHFIAVLTYGKEKHGDQSDFKLGQGAGTEVLLTLFGTHAREFTLPRATFRYMYVDVPSVSTHKNYVVLRVTSDEKAQVETVCRRQGHYTWVYLWEPEFRRWLEFPCAPQALYVDPTSYGGICPKFLPTDTAFVTPSQLNNEVAKESVLLGKVTLTQSDDWWWITGDTYPHRETLRTAGAKWSKTRRAWYFKGQLLPTAIQALSPLVKDATNSDRADIIEQTVLPPNPDQSIQVAVVPDDPPVPVDATPVVEPLPENIRLAIQRLKEARKVVTPHPKTGQPPSTASPITHEYVGELTGSITGTVHCFGYAIEQGTCVYANFAGPRMAVEAIRAKFSKGDVVNCSAYGAPSVELTAGESNTGRYTAFMQSIPEARYTSVILLHDQIISPNYGGKSRTCILRTDAAQGIAMLKHHITQLVSIPVFDAMIRECVEREVSVERPVRLPG